MHPPLPRRSRLPVRLAVALAWLAAVAPASAADRGAGRVVPDFAALDKELIRLPAPPAWTSGETSALWTVDDLRAAFARATDTPPEINHSDSALLVPSSSWVRHYNAWFAKLRRPLKLRFEDQQWDCDNYAHCFATFAELLAMRGGETRGNLAVGWASVYYREPFAGIGAGTAHAVVVVATGEGLVVVEPQDGTMVPLENFPNRDTISAVYF